MSADNSGERRDREANGGAADIHISNGLRLKLQKRVEVPTGDTAASIAHNAARMEARRKGFPKRRRLCYRSAIIS